MKKQTTFIIGIILGCLIALGGTTALADNELSAAEVTELFSGKTVEGINVGKGYSFKAYFDPNGTVRAKYPVGGRQGKWRVDKKGRKCIKWEDQSKEKCFVLVKEGEVYEEFKIKKDGRRKHVATFKKFTEGNLYGL
jgi:hypothetical protein